jgi:hypothetical protein
MRLSRSHRNRLLAAAALALLPQPARSQLAPQHSESAAPVPTGMIRLSGGPSWSRAESWLTGSGSETSPLGISFTTDTLGTGQLPGLAPIEGAVRTLTGDQAFRLSLGRSRDDRGVRVVRTSFALEYGVSRRLSVGAMIPLVQTRTTAHLILEGDGNVGPNPTLVNPVRFAEASAVRQQLVNAATSLNQRLASCRADPAQSGCQALLDDEAGALQLVGRSQEFLSGLTLLYGAEPSAGQRFVPVAGSGAQEAIDAQLAAMSAAFGGYLGSAPPIVARPPYSAGGAGSADARSLFLGGAFGLPADSLQTLDKIGIGDVELGAKYLLLDSWIEQPDTAQLPRRIRVALTGLVRLGTGSPARPEFYLDQPLGDGQLDIEGGAIVDLLAGRFGATMSARYTAQLGEIESWRVPDERGWVSPFDPLVRGTRTLGNVLAVHVTPRARFGPALSVDAHWGVTRKGDDEYSFDRSSVDPDQLVLRPALDGPRGGFTAQQIGIGLTFSTLGMWEQGRVRVPLEVSISHLQMITASGAAVPRLSTDQLQLKLYYRLLRR